MSIRANSAQLLLKNMCPYRRTPMKTSPGPWKMKKNPEKVVTIQRWLANTEVHLIQTMGSPDGNQESSDADSDSDDSIVDSDDQSSDDDIVLMEVGETSDDDSESESEEAQPRSRSGRSCTTYLTRHFLGDSDWMTLNTLGFPVEESASNKKGAQKHCSTVALYSSV